MTLFEKITLCMAIIMTIMCIVQVIAIVRWNKKIKSYEEKIAIKHSKTGSYFWLGVAAVNIAVEGWLLMDYLDNYNISIANGYLFATLMWVAFFIFMILPTVLVRYHYITPEGLLHFEAKDFMYRSDDCKYEIKGDVLMIKCQKHSTAVKYRMTQEVNKLKELLDTYYEEK